MMELLDTKYSLCYVGHSVINSYFTDATLPWIIAEIELSRRLQNVLMHLTSQAIELKRDFVSRIPSTSGNSVTTPDGLESLAEDLMKFDDLDIVDVESGTPTDSVQSVMESILHVPYDKIMHAKKIQRNHSSYFVLLIRESKDQPIFCHTFKADINIITIISNDIEKRITLKGKNGLPCIFNKAGSESQSHSDNDCIRFEVMLVGIVNLKNPDPPHTLIDQAVVEFDGRYKKLEQHRNENGNNDNTIGHLPLSPGYIDSGSPTGSYMDDSREGSAEILRQMRQRCSSFGHDIATKPARRQRHKSEPSTYVGDSRKTRIRLFQIGQNSIKMICPNKAVRTCEIEFANISRCMQGIEQRDHFGMIMNGMETVQTNHVTAHTINSKKVICYVFKCSDENVCEEIMQGIRQAFSTCFYETSPMQDFDSLCIEINAATPDTALSIAKRKMWELDENEIQMVTAQIMEINPKNENDKLAAFMAALRQLFEMKHVKHLEETKRTEDLNQNIRPDSPGSKFDNIRSKALLSFGNWIQKSKKKMQELQLDAEHLSGKHVTSPVQRLKHISEAFATPATPHKHHSVKNSPSGQSPSSHKFTRTHSTSPSFKPHSLQFNEKMKGGAPFLFYHRIFHNITNTGPYAKSLSSSFSHSTPERPEKKRKRYETVEDIRQAWKWAIRQQILLNKISSIASSKPKPTSLANGQNEYMDLTPVPDDMEEIWMELFQLSIGEKEKLEPKVLHAAVQKGVLNSYRGKVWKLLRLHCYNEEDLEGKSHIQAYQKLLDNLTSYQHAILIDIGRTFPTHPMYRQLLGPGQLSLFNVLKAYSLLDEEVGYCQGLSFIAGVLLMHTCIEDEAYQLLYCIMHEVGCRSMYLPDMKGMKLAMYKMTRLLHDFDIDIFEFFERYEVTMMLVATPWFLTMFASSFPMGFVARVFDMVFVDGIAALFKIAICLLEDHKPTFLTLDDFEDVVNYIKTEIPQSDNECLSRVLQKAMDMFIDPQLQEYEVEYRILCEELQISNYYMENEKHLEEQIHCLENVNHKVTESNCDLLRQLNDAQQKVAMLQKQFRD